MIWMFFEPSKSRERAKILNIVVPKTNDHFKIKIKIPNPSQEPPASSKAQNRDLRDMDALCTSKIKIESQKLDHGCIKYHWPYPNHNQDAKPQSAPSKAPNEDFEDLQNQDRADLLWDNLRQTKYLIKAELPWANLRQNKYLIKAERLWANLRRTKY